jgi:Reverse transcriptase (RNA-dependent DNA polymerase)
MTMEPGTPLLSTSGHTYRPGRSSAPPANTLAPPIVSLPTYPSSTLNNYFHQSNSFIHHDQNNAHTFAPAFSNFYDPNILPPSASQSHVPTIRRTPSSSLRSMQSTRDLQNPVNTNPPHSPSNIQQYYVPLSPLIFQSPLHTSPTNNHRTQINTLQTRRHSIFSPQIINSPLPNNTVHSPSPRPQSARLPTPNIIHQPNNIIAPQPVYPTLPLPLNPQFSPSSESSHISSSSHSSRSQHISSSRATLKFSLPSTKDIPLLTGKHDWGPWHSAVSSLVLCSNLLSHIADDLLPGAAYDPDLWPTYPPVLQPSSSPEERTEFSNWWSRDGVATHILVSRLSPTVLGSLPIANLRLAQRRSARDVYRALRSNYGAGDYSAVMIIETKLRQLRCLPTRGGVRVNDYVATWRTAYNQMEAAGHLPSERQLLAMFVDGLPTNSVSFITLYDNILNSLNDNSELPNIHHLFDHTIRIESNILRTRLLNPSLRSLSHTSSTSSPSTLNKTSTTTPTQIANPTVNCGNCGRRHPTDKCFQPGGVMEGKKEEVLASRPVRAQAYLAEIDEGVEPEEVKTDDENLLTNEFAAMSISQPNDINLSTYALSSVTDAFEDIPLALASLSQTFNSALDSACTNHIIRDRNLFHRYDTGGGVPVKTANCGFLETLAVGDVKFRITINGRTIIWTLKNCLHAPAVPINLISVGALQEHHISVTFSYQKTLISFPMDHPDLTGLSFEATVHRRLSLLDLEFIDAPLVNPEPTIAIPALACPVFPVAPITTDLWHRRFGHLGQDATRDMLSHNFATGITPPTSSANVPTKCIPCLIGKTPQAPYQNNAKRASNVCELIHIDTCGPFPVPTPRKEQYFTIFLDDTSNYGHTALLVAKSESFQAYKKVEASWELKSGNRVKGVRFDGAKEFTQGSFAEHLTGRGIAVQVTAPYAHSQAGKAERYIRTIEDGIQTLIADAKLPPSFWGDAALTYQYLRNRLPTSTLPHEITPYEVMNHVKPDLSHLRVWGCQCFPAIPPELRTKGGPRRYEAIFVGYEENRVGWRVRDLKGRYHFSRDVVFNESIPGHLSPRRGNPIDFARLPPASIIPHDHSHPVAPLPPESLPHTTLTSLPTPSFVDAVQDRDMVIDNRNQRATRSTTNSLPPQRRHYNDIEVISMFVSLNKINAFLTDPISTNVVYDPPPTDPDLLYDQCFLTAPPSFLRARPYDLSKPPNSYHEAVSRPDKPVWLAAMQREMSSLEERKAFERTLLPVGRKAIGVRWTYDYKYEPDGSVIRGKEKARLVAQGFSQRPEDFDETYAPVVKLVSVRTLLAFANHHDYEIMSFDVKTAFLHARLPYSIYVKQIPGYPENDPKTVLRLLVALYGLKQSAYEWYTLLASIFSALGLLRCEADHAVFIGRWSTPPDPSVVMPESGEQLVLIVPIHVDDGLAICNSKSLYTWFVREISKKIDFVCLGPVTNSRYLGQRITRDRIHRIIRVSQSDLVINLLEDWKMTECKTSLVPLPHNFSNLPPCSPNACPDIPDADITVAYQRLVGSLTYLAICTRPDLAYAAMALGQFNASPTRTLLVVAKGVLRYLAGTVHFGLTFSLRNEHLPESVQLYASACGLSDADWASDEKDRKSISGYCFYFCNSLVSWSARKQRTVSTSSTESEYYALANTMKEAIWLKLFLKLTQLYIPPSFPLLCDNQSTRSIASTDAISPRTKHIDVRYHFLREHITNGSFPLHWIPTSDMVADIFTKPLSNILFQRHRESLGLLPI